MEAGNQGVYGLGKATVALDGFGTNLILFEMILMWYCAFLYGVNIPGGQKVSLTDLPKALSILGGGFQYRESIRNSGNLLFTGPGNGPPSSLQALIQKRLGIKCVVKTLPELEGYIRKGGQLFGTAPPSHVQKSGAIWEIGLVLLAEPLPKNLPDNAWCYSLKNAQSVCLLDSSTVLVLKKSASPRGSRIMFGSVVLNPLQRRLRHHGISADPATSRSLGTIRDVLGATKVAGGSA